MYDASSSQRSGWVLDTNPNGGWRWCGISAEECQQECVSLGNCAAIYHTPNQCCFPTKDVCFAGSTPGGAGGVMHVLHEFCSESNWVGTTSNSWCGQSNTNMYDASSSERSGWALDNNSNGGWRWCGISAEECQQECESLGNCAGIYHTPNQCCFPTQSTCDGNTAPGGAGGRAYHIA